MAPKPRPTNVGGEGAQPHQAEPRRRQQQLRRDGLVELQAEVCERIARDALLQFRTLWSEAHQPIAFILDVARPEWSARQTLFREGLESFAMSAANAIAAAESCVAVLLLQVARFPHGRIVDVEVPESHERDDIERAEAVSRCLASGHVISQNEREESRLVLEAEVRDRLWCEATSAAGRLLAESQLAHVPALHRSLSIAPEDLGGDQPGWPSTEQWRDILRQPAAAVCNQPSNVMTMSAFVMEMEALQRCEFVSRALDDFPIGVALCQEALLRRATEAAELEAFDAVLTVAAAEHHARRLAAPPPPPPPRPSGGVNESIAEIPRPPPDNDPIIAPGHPLDDSTTGAAPVTAAPVTAAVDVRPADNPAAPPPDAAVAPPAAAEPDAAAAPPAHAVAAPPVDAAAVATPVAPHPPIVPRIELSRTARTLREALSAFPGHVWGSAAAPLPPRLVVQHSHKGETHPAPPPVNTVDRVEALVAVEGDCREARMHDARRELHLLWLDAYFPLARKVLEDAESIEFGGIVTDAPSRRLRAEEVVEPPPSQWQTTPVDAPNVAPATTAAPSTHVRPGDAALLRLFAVDDLEADLRGVVEQEEKLNFRRWWCDGHQPVRFALDVVQPEAYARQHAKRLYLLHTEEVGADAIAAAESCVASLLLQVARFPHGRIVDVEVPESHERDDIERAEAVSRCLASGHVISQNEREESRLVLEAEVRDRLWCEATSAAGRLLAESQLAHVPALHRSLSIAPEDLGGDQPGWPSTEQWRDILRQPAAAVCNQPSNVMTMSAFVMEMEALQRCEFVSRALDDFPIGVALCQEALLRRATEAAELDAFDRMRTLMTPPTAATDCSVASTLTRPASTPPSDRSVAHNDAPRSDHLSQPCAAAVTIARPPANAENATGTQHHEEPQKARLDGPASAEASTTRTATASSVPPSEGQETDHGTDMQCASLAPESKSAPGAIAVSTNLDAPTGRQREGVDVAAPPKNDHSTRPERATAVGDVQQPRAPTLGSMSAAGPANLAASVGGTRPGVTILGGPTDGRMAPAHVVNRIYATRPNAAHRLAHPIPDSMDKRRVAALEELEGDRRQTLSREWHVETAWAVFRQHEPALRQQLIELQERGDRVVLQAMFQAGPAFIPVPCVVVVAARQTRSSTPPPPLQEPAQVKSETPCPLPQEPFAHEEPTAPPAAATNRLIKEDGRTAAAATPEPSEVVVAPQKPPPPTRADRTPIDPTIPLTTSVSWAIATLERAQRRLIVTEDATERLPLLRSIEPLCRVHIMAAECLARQDWLVHLEGSQRLLDLTDPEPLAWRHIASNGFEDLEALATHARFGRMHDVITRAKSSLAMLVPSATKSRATTKKDLVRALTRPTRLIERQGATVPSTPPSTRLSPSMSSWPPPLPVALPDVVYESATQRFDGCFHIASAAAAAWVDAMRLAELLTFVAEMEREQRVIALEDPEASCFGQLAGQCFLATAGKSMALDFVACTQDTMQLAFPHQVGLLQCSESEQRHAGLTDAESRRRSDLIGGHATTSWQLAERYALSAECDRGVAPILLARIDHVLELLQLTEVHQRLVDLGDAEAAEWRHIVYHGFDALETLHRTARYGPLAGVLEQWTPLWLQRSRTVKKPRRDFIAELSRHDYPCDVVVVVCDPSRQQQQPPSDDATGVTGGGGGGGECHPPHEAGAAEEASPTPEVRPGDATAQDNGAPRHSVDAPPRVDSTRPSDHADAASTDAPAPFTASDSSLETAPLNADKPLVDSPRPAVLTSLEAVGATKGIVTPPPAALTDAEAEPLFAWELFCRAQWRRQEERARRDEVVGGMESAARMLWLVDEEAAEWAAIQERGFAPLTDLVVHARQGQCVVQ